MVKTTEDYLSRLEKGDTIDFNYQKLVDIFKDAEILNKEMTLEEFEEFNKLDSKNEIPLERVKPIHIESDNEND